VSSSTRPQSSREASGPRRARSIEAGRNRLNPLLNVNAALVVRVKLRFLIVVDDRLGQPNVFQTVDEWDVQSLPFTLALIVMWQH
jgi:hypothetical protein